MAKRRRGGGGRPKGARSQPKPAEPTLEEPKAEDSPRQRRTSKKERTGDNPGSSAGPNPTTMVSGPASGGLIVMGVLFGLIALAITVAFFTE